MSSVLKELVPGIGQFLLGQKLSGRLHNLTPLSIDCWWGVCGRIAHLRDSLALQHYNVLCLPVDLHQRSMLIRRWHYCVPSGCFVYFINFTFTFHCLVMFFFFLLLIWKTPEQHAYTCFFPSSHNVKKFPGPWGFLPFFLFLSGERQRCTKGFGLNNFHQWNTLEIR